ncbi:MAG: DUF488 domain-containing protein [Methanomicrobiales archaeon]|nr:DUF488 domain-containing protein [Methanomicrobiales archaeon]
MPEETIYTIGHSTRSLPEFIGILKAYRITVVIDIRSIPRSRHNPRFDRDTLAGALGDAGIRYLHCTDLGGFRKAEKGSVNTAWTSRAFRGFADHMQRGEFSRAIERLIEITENETPVLMCAEGNPYRCHRRLIADALVVRGVRVVHLATRRSGKPHTLTPFARVEEGKITYPALEPKDTEKRVRQGVLG